jgi:UDP-N-acetyl-2-amino-2-deoxyglucuronate dehydrogenase
MRGARGAPMSDAPVRTALVGCGNIGARHAQALCEIAEAELAAVFDLDAARAKDFAARFGTRAAESFESLLSSGDVESVVLAVPADRHAELGLRCVEAGKALLSEKPLDVLPARAAALVRAAALRGVPLSVVAQNRFFDDVAWLRQALASGALGRPVLVEAATIWHRDQAYYDAAPGRGRLVPSEGGVLLNQAVHCLDLVLWLCGGVVSIASHSATLTHEMACEDTATLSLRFASGALGSVVATTSTLAEPERIEVRCERATVALCGGVAVRFDGERLEGVLPPPSLRVRAPATVDKLEPFRRQHRDFAAAVRHRRPPTVTGAEGLAVVELIAAAYRASAQGVGVGASSSR